MCENQITGHYRPVIDSELCIDCGKCVRKCPANHSYAFHDNMQTYAAYRTTAEDQTGSSSGGVAAAFYETAIDNQWYVVGTRMTTGFNTEMILTNARDDLFAFRGSKYVQANTKSVYEQLKNVLRDGKNVLFIGTPCQCEAARTAAGNNKEQLVTVDLICHGVPSQRTFKQYIEWVEQRKKRKVKNVSFRSPWGVEMVMNDGKRDIWKRRMYWDPYFETFSCGIINNEACYQCPFAQEKRVSDLTIGDFWGIGKTKPFQSPNRKVSVIGVNTPQGEKFLKMCSSLILEERDWDEAVSGNSQLQNALPKSPLYDLFWKTYMDSGLDDALKATVYDKVTKKYRKEYPKIYLKAKVKNAVKKIVGYKGER